MPEPEPEPRAIAQTRTPRAIGIEHMVEATIRLLQDRSPEQVTVRDIANASGHHHRFVQAWFGGKVPLLREVFDRLIEDAARDIHTPLVSRGQFSRELRTAALLLNWLMAADPGSLDAPRPTPIIDRVTQIYRSEFGLDEDLARLMALRLVSGAVSIMLFSGPLGIANDELPALMQLEIDLARLLARSRTTVD